MEKIYIIGASGFGKEVAWLIEELDKWDIAGFIDDNEFLQGEEINGIPVVGTCDFLQNRNQSTNVVIAIGNPQIRFKIYNTLKSNKNLHFPNIIAKGIRISDAIEMGKGNIICSNSILTVNIRLGDFNQINLDCTIGHDSILNSFITIYPSVNVSGNVKIGDFCELGTGSKIIQNKKMTDKVIMGAGAVVIKDILISGTYVGTPAVKIK